MSAADPRLVALLERSGADGLVSGDPALVRMLAGHSAWLETGPSPFAAGPLVVAPGDGPAWLVVSETDGAEADRLVPIDGFSPRPIDRAGAIRDGLRRALVAAGLAGRAVAVDGAAVPAAALAAVDDPREPVDLPGLSAVKTAAEVDAIARAVELADAGQAAARIAARAGASELQAWTAARAAMEARAGGRIVVGADFVSGPRCARVGGPPSTRRIADGELVLCDLSPRRDGVWADSCATWSVGEGEPDPAVVALHGAASATLVLGLELLRPGAVAGEVDAAMRAAMSEAGHAYPHHSGHGVGFSAHEEPRIVPDATRVLEAGMVVALEPAGYDAEAGVGLRVEQVAVVGDGAPRILSRHALDLHQR